MTKRLWLAIPVSLTALLGTVALARTRTAHTAAVTGSYQVFTVKFACGEFGKTAAANVPEGPYAPGFYQTAINLHDTALPPTIDAQNQAPILFYKKAVLDYAADATNAPRPETTFEARAPFSTPVSTELTPDAGMLIDCQDIRAVLLKRLPPGIAAPSAPTFIEGDVVIMVPPQSSQFGPLAPLRVEAVYTSNGFDCAMSAAGGGCTGTTRSGISQEVETIAPQTVNNP